MSAIAVPSESVSSAVHSGQDQRGRDVVVAIYHPTHLVSGVGVIVLPGAYGTIDRYRWLEGPLTDAGHTVAIAEAPVVMRRTPFSRDQDQPTRFLTIDQFAVALRIAKTAAPQVQRWYAIGHSLGGAVILEGLDPTEAERNPNAERPRYTNDIHDLAGVVILGASLQPEALGMVIPYRSSDRPLSKPRQTHLLFISGSEDRMASAAAMLATANRYLGADVECIEGANHLGWMEGRGPFDRPDLDGAAKLTPERQRELTANLTLAFIATSVAKPIGAT